MSDNSRIINAEPTKDLFIYMLVRDIPRQWSDQSIARTTPTLLELFSLVVILADHLQANFSWTIQQTIWYSKFLPTFSDALALVRRFLWASTFSTSSETTQMIKVPRLLFERLRDIAVYAA